MTVYQPIGTGNWTGGWQKLLTKCRHLSLPVCLSITKRGFASHNQINRPTDTRIYDSMCKHPSAANPASTDNGPGSLSPAALALVPNYPVCKAALQLAQSSLPVSIFNHSFRTFLYSSAFAANTTTVSTNTSLSDPVPVTAELLFVVCILHDIGTATAYDTAPERFEVAAADAIAELLHSHGVDEAGVYGAWLAAALHTSSGIAERLGGLVWAVRMGVRADFGSYPVPEGDFKGRVLIDRGELSRLGIEKDLGDAVVRQALLVRGKAPKGSWPGDLLRAKELYPGWEGVNKGF